MSDSYHNFAYVYDTFMDNIPYEDWSCYLSGLLQEYGISGGTLVELGCGTASLCLLMKKQGYEIIGIDNSIDMLSIASDKTAEQSGITLLHQDMRKLSLGGTYDAFYCLCDSFNYLMTDEDAIAALSCVRRHLKQNGVFIFDLKTPYFYETILGDQVFCDHQEQCSYTWENSYFEEDRINQYDLTIFVKQPESALFERFVETHHQRAYELPEIIEFLQSAGLTYLTSYEAFTKTPPTPESERIYIIARNGDKIYE